MTGKKIKFALKLKEGVEARNLQELKEAFDLNQIIAYFLDGKLETWLLDRYYNDLAEKIGSLEKSDPELRRKVCEIFEVEYEEDSLSVEEIEKRSQRIRKLKEITDDETIIRHVDKVAFTQEELADLLDSGQETIYLCGTGFDIPVNKKGIRYIGIETKLDITEEEREQYEANDIELIDLFKDYFDETREEFKKRERHGEVLLNTTGNAQDSTQESNNCVPEEDEVAATASTDNAAQEPENTATDRNPVPSVKESAQPSNTDSIFSNLNMFRHADDVKFRVTDTQYKKAEELHLTSEQFMIFETVNGIHMFNYSVYKNFWSMVYEIVKAEIKRILPTAEYEETVRQIDGVIADILKSNGIGSKGESVGDIWRSACTSMTESKTVDKPKSTITNNPTESKVNNVPPKTVSRPLDKTDTTETIKLEAIRKLFQW